MRSCRDSVRPGLGQAGTRSCETGSGATARSGAGYAWRAYGENIAAGQTSAQAVVDGWLASPGHCANIMNASYVDMATACVASNTATYRTYWTMDLGRPY